MDIIFYGSNIRIFAILPHFQCFTGNSEIYNLKPQYKALGCVPPACWLYVAACTGGGGRQAKSWYWGGTCYQGVVPGLGHSPGRRGIRGPGGVPHLGEVYLVPVGLRGQVSPPSL